MKKILVASFFAIIMMLVPFTTVAQASDVPKSIVEKPQFFITEQQLAYLNFYLEASYEGEDYDQAIAIRDDIITDLEVALVKLAESWEETARTVEGVGLMKRKEDYMSPVPSGVMVLTAGADIQEDRRSAVAFCVETHRRVAHLNDGRVAWHDRLIRIGPVVVPRLVGARCTSDG